MCLTYVSEEGRFDWITKINGKERDMHRKVMMYATKRVSKLKKKWHEWRYRMKKKGRRALHRYDFDFYFLLLWKYIYFLSMCMYFSFISIGKVNALRLSLLFFFMPWKKVSCLLFIFKCDCGLTRCCGLQAFLAVE